jgi:hypothetical protein
MPQPGIIEHHAFAQHASLSCHIHFSYTLTPSQRTDGCGILSPADADSAADENIPEPPSLGYFSRRQKQQEGLPTCVQSRRRFDLRLFTFVAALKTSAVIIVDRQIPALADAKVPEAWEFEKFRRHENYFLSSTTKINTNERGDKATQLRYI